MPWTDQPFAGTGERLLHGLSYDRSGHFGHVEIDKVTTPDGARYRFSAGNLFGSDSIVVESLEDGLRQLDTALQKIGRKS